MLLIDMIANPWIFSVKTVDVAASLARNYQQSYININRHAFDLWVKSLIPTSVEVYHNNLCRKIWREDDKWHVIFRADGWEQYITTRYLVGTGGANSMVRRHLYPDHQIREYVAIQQWFAEKHPVPFYSCTFDNSITNCCSWSVNKGGYLIFGSAYPMKDGQTRFTTLKKKMGAFRFQFGKAVESEKCMVPFPSRWQGFIRGKGSALLIGEAAGLISTSSLERISYALDSADILCTVLLRQSEELNTAYWRAARKLRLKLFGKIVKSRCLTAPALRKWIMRSGMMHIPQLKN